MAITRITKGVIKPNENYDTHNINSTGIVTATGLDINGNADVSGALSVGGVLTYEDVTSIDSVGIITARSGLVSPNADIDDFISVGSNIHLGNAGVITATSFVGDGSGLIGVASTDNIITGTAATFNTYPVDINAGMDVAGVTTAVTVDINGDIDVDGHTNLDNVSVSGISTFSGILDATNTPASIRVAQEIQHKGDADTALSFGTDIISLKTAGTERLRIQADGDVSFGDETTGRAQIKHLSGDQANRNAGGFPQYAFVGNEGTGMRRVSSNVLAFDTTGEERIRINSGGSIGIGTDNPAYGLDVRVDNFTKAQFKGKGANENNIPFYIMSGSSAVQIGNEPSGGQEKIIFQASNDSMRFHTAGEERVRIDQNGKVAIGTDFPTEALEVRGNIFCRGATTSDKPRIKFGFTNGVIQGGKTEGNVGQDYLAISADGGTTDHFVVDYGGNVGISSINPQRPLDVRGEVFANRFTAYSAPTSTYNNQTTGVKYGARGAYTLTLGGNRSSNTNSFTIFEAKDFNNSKYFCLEISFHHAGGGVHGSYRRFAGMSNGYTSITTLHDTGNVNVGGGLGFAFTKPDNHTLRVTWNGCSSFADSYTLYCKLDVSNGNTYFSAIDSAFY